jgi:hypothetical protein
MVASKSILTARVKKSSPSPPPSPPRRGSSVATRVGCSTASGNVSDFPGICFGGIRQSCEVAFEVGGLVGLPLRGGEGWGEGEEQTNFRSKSPFESISREGRRQQISIARAT